MREFNFRAWNNERNEMANGDCKDTSDNINWKLPFMSEVSLINILLSKESYIYMQSTGIFDIQSNEIYESDIVLKKTSATVYGVKGNMIVVFDDGAFYLTAIGKNDVNRLTQHSVQRYGLEVVGNIYENPELTIRSQLD